MSVCFQIIVFEVVHAAYLVFCHKRRGCVLLKSLFAIVISLWSQRLEYESFYTEHCTCFHVAALR